MAGIYRRVAHRRLIYVKADFLSTPLLRRSNIVAVRFAERMGAVRREEQNGCGGTKRGAG